MTFVNLEMLNDKDIYFPEATSMIPEEELINFIRMLPEGYQQVLNMFVVDGFTHAEIGRILLIKESYSRAILTRAKIKLRALISTSKLLHI